MDQNEYDPHSDPDIHSDIDMDQFNRENNSEIEVENIQITRMETRSMDKNKNNNNNNNKNKDFDNVDFDISIDQSKTREEFLTELFGYRNQLDIFDMDIFKLYQESDNILQLAKSLLDKNEDERDTESLELILKWDSWLWNKLTGDELQISNYGTLQALHYITARGRHEWCDIVPFCIRGKLIDYEHHNLQLHHFHFQQTFDNIDSKYCWGSMKADVRWYCETCLLCQYVKGSPRRRAPLRIRKLPKPRQHLFADFLGPVLGSQYYILFLVDYATGYSMLIPTNGTDAPTVVNSIITYWVPIFGWFTVFESDWASSFNNELMFHLTQLAHIKIELAEPRNHRSIGKVERIIGFVQSIIARFNVLINERFTQRAGDTFQAWQTIESMIPFIQLALNQRRPRFTTISPNMLMFGTNLNDISDIDRVRKRLEDIHDDKQINKNDYDRLFDIMNKIKMVNDQFKQDWIDYTWLSHMSYNEKYKITDDKIKRYNNLFKVGKEVMYFIGDKQVAMHKWKSKWTGPWRIDFKLNDSTIVLVDPSTGNQKRVSMDRIKLYKRKDFQKYKQFMDNDQDYERYEEELADNLSNYSVKFRKPEIELDYSKKVKFEDSK
jgi:hypothetical protein